MIQFIRSSRELHSGELVLIVRPNGESRGGGPGSSLPFFHRSVFHLFFVVKDLYMQDVHLFQSPLTVAFKTANGCMCYMNL